LGGSEVGGDGDGIVEPIIPREGESVSRGEKPGGIDVEGPYVRGGQDTKTIAKR